MTERRTSKWLWLALLAFGVSVTLPVVARELPSGLPAPYPQSTLEVSVDIQSSGHLVLFSPVREIRDEIRSDVMARLPVSGQGQLFELNRDASRQAARAYYRDQLSAAGASVLFECTGIACGRSNVWANQIFQQARLLGRDANQDYLVTAISGSDGNNWLTLVYTVTRGNLREYVWVEHLAVPENVPIPGFAGGGGLVKGPLVVPWQGGITYRFDWSANDRRALNDWANGNADVILASFTGVNPEESFEAALERARRAAESLSEVLAKTGVSRSQIRIVPVGPAVKVGDATRQGDRIEVLVIRR